MCAALVAVLTTGLVLAAGGQSTGPPTAHLTPLDRAQHHFYSGRYDETLAALEGVAATGTEALAALELRSSALHFKVRRLMGDADDRNKAFKACQACPALLDAFTHNITGGKALAKARLQANPKDEAALFYQGKFNLNYIWMQLATLGRRTGWGEYWDARRSLDAALRINPANVRARVARAWIDYIVDTRVPFGLQWMLGGGDRKRALRHLREAVEAAATPFEHAEAEFGLWEMLAREQQMDEAVAVARHLLQDFPENQELQRFVKARAPGL